MAEKTMKGFDVLFDLAGKFVEMQKGVWDHTAWLNFLSDLQKKGLKLSEDMKPDIGLMLEAIKKYYDASTATKGMTNVMVELSDFTMDFFKKTRGVWDYSEWEIFLKDLQNKGFDLTDETRSYLQGIFDSAKGLYRVLTPVASKTGEESKKGAKETKTAK